MPEETPKPPDGVDPSDESVKAWAEYSKDRFEWVERRVQLYRERARHLATAAAILLGLDLTLTAGWLDLQRPLGALRNGFLLCFLVGAFLQLVLSMFLLWLGYGWRVRILFPDNPVLVAKELTEADPTTTFRLIGSSYANRYKKFFDLSERIGRQIAWAAALLVLSLLIIGVGVLGFWQARSGESRELSYTGSSMSESREPQVRKPEPAPSPLPSKVPVDGPLQRPPERPPLIVPTPGEPGTTGAKGPFHKL